MQYSGVALTFFLIPQKLQKAKLVNTVSVISTLQNLDLQLEFSGIGNGTQPGTQIWIKLFLILKKSKISELQLT